MARRNTIIIIKRDVLKRVTLQKDKHFLAPNKQSTRSHLLATIHLERSYKECPVPKGKRRRSRIIAQQGQGIGNIFCFVKKLEKVRLNKTLEKWLLNNFLECMKNCLVK